MIHRNEADVIAENEQLANEVAELKTKLQAAETNAKTYLDAFAAAKSTASSTAIGTTAGKVQTLTDQCLMAKGAAMSDHGLLDRAELVALNDNLSAQNTTLRAENEALKSKLADAEAKLNRGESSARLGTAKPSKGPSLTEQCRIANGK